VREKERKKGKGSRTDLERGGRRVTAICLHREKKQDRKGKKRRKERRRAEGRSEKGAEEAELLFPNLRTSEKGERRGRDWQKSLTATFSTGKKERKGRERKIHQRSSKRKKEGKKIQLEI